MKKEKNILASYDESEYTEQEIKYRLEEKKVELDEEIKEIKKVIKKHFNNNGYFTREELIDILLDRSELKNIYIKTSKNGHIIYDIDENEISERVNADSDLFSFMYDDFLCSLDEMVNERKKEGGYWYCEGTNLNWRGASGSKYFRANTGREFFEEIKPNTNELTATFYERKKGKIEVRISHHDCPTGSYYTIKPISEKQYEQATE